MNLDLYSVIAGVLFGFGIGTLFGFSLGLFMYGRMTKDIYARIKGFLSVRRDSKRDS